MRVGTRPRLVYLALLGVAVTLFAWGAVAQVDPPTAGSAKTVRAQLPQEGGELSEEDRLAREDDKADKPKEPPAESELFPDTELGRKLRHHMEVLALPAETLEEADRRYQESLREIRKHHREAAELLAQAYEKAPADWYFDRWALVKALADLESGHAYQVLSTLAASKVPAEASENRHYYSTQEQEVMIRLRAVDGLRDLAAQGHEGADQDLLRIAADPATPGAVKGHAIKGYLGAGKDTAERAKTLRGRLPRELHELITLEATPPDVFHRRVKAQLARLSEEKTSEDAQEEKLPEEKAPPAKPPQ